MLTCVYHSLGTMRVVEDEEATKLLDTGVWFNCPAEARKSKDKIAKEVADEANNKAAQKTKGTSK